MDSRRYLKRVWRVPKDRGPAECLGTLVLKLMRKHGWPAVLRLDLESSPYGGFQIAHDRDGLDGPEDFMAAVGIAVRITAGRCKVEVDHYRGSVELSLPYEVTEAGRFKELPQE